MTTPTLMYLDAPAPAVRELTKAARRIAAEVLPHLAATERREKLDAALAALNAKATTPIDPRESPFEKP